MTIASDYYEFLAESIADGGSKALNEVWDTAFSDSEVMVKSPAVLAMVCWGETGLRKIVELPLTDPTSKNTSAALKALAMVAAGGSVHPSLFFLRDENLLQTVANYLEQNDLSATARSLLVELVLSFPTDDLLIPFGTAFSQVSLAEADITDELIGALSSKWLRIGPQTLAEYSELLGTKPGNELAFQQFFCRYPQLLDPLAVQVWSQPDFHGVLEPDFVIRRIDDTYLVVEIECPDKRIVTSGDQLSAWATYAETQVVEYRSFIVERLQEVRSTFPNIRDPDCLVVIGMEADLTPSQKKALLRSNESRHNQRVVGFDWLLARAATTVANMGIGEIEVVQGARVV